jgi:uncharacterized protein (DUF2384 family)
MAMVARKSLVGTKAKPNKKGGGLVVLKRESGKAFGGVRVLQRESFSGRFMSAKGTIAVDRVVQSFGLSKAQLAATVGLSVETLYRSNRVDAPKTQARLKEMLEIVDRIADWAGGKDQAMAWYRAEPIPAFGGRTAESLVKDGKAGDVRDYLDHVALGGFA